VYGCVAGFQAACLLYPPTAQPTTLTHTRRSGQQLNTDETRLDLWRTLWMLPIIYVILMVKRLLLTLAFRPLFKAIKGDLVRLGASWVDCSGGVGRGGRRGRALPSLYSTAQQRAPHHSSLCSLHSSHPPTQIHTPHPAQTLRDATFLTVAGLRGSASLIMGQAVVTEVQMYKTDPVRCCRALFNLVVVGALESFPVVVLSCTHP